MKNTRITVGCLVVGIALAGGAATANASSIPVVSYTYLAGLDGDYNTLYQDPSNTKLTDGNLGTPYVLDGTWVGWYEGYGGTPQITFNFGSVVTVTNVDLNFMRQDDAITEFPTSVVIGGVNFATTGPATDDTEELVDYAGSWTGSSLTVTANFNTSGFIFLNEAEFSDVPASAPEPVTAAMLLTGLAGVGLFRRRRS